MYYGYYSSVGFGATINSFVTKSQDTLLFPPQVMYNNSPYRLIRTFLISTPKQEEQFETFCVNQSCERDVEIS